MEDKIIRQMLDSLRATAISQLDQLEVGLFILSWAKLSATKTISADVRISASLLDNPSRTRKALLSFGVSADEDFRVPDGIRPALELALKLSETGVLQHFDPADAICYDDTNWYGGRFAISKEVADLLIALLGPTNRKSESVYAPWDWSGQLAARAIKRASHVFLETHRESKIPIWVSLLAERPFDVKFGDPIQSPSWIENGKLRLFDLAVACPPFGARYDVKIVEQDLLGRFPEHTSSGSVLTIRHLLSQARRRIVVATPSTLLFSSGVEQALREDLVKRGMIRAVINMPSGLFTSTTIPFAILILCPSGGCDRIKFINADTGEFTEAISKARNRLVNIDQLAELSLNDAESEGATFVSSSEVLNRDSLLLVGRYVMPKEKRKILELVSAEESCEFREVVTTVRPMPTTTAKKDAIVAGEVGAADLPPFGYITSPGRNVLVNGKTSEENADQFLRPLDIVLIIKGSVGKVGIIPEGVPPPGPGGWVAGQSAIVLRVKKDVIDPRVVAMQIRSPRGQEVLKFATTGATIPLIPLKMLMKLPIFIPDNATTRKAADALERETQIQGEIDRLRRSQSEFAKDLWSL